MLTVLGLLGRRRAAGTGIRQLRLLLLLLGGLPPE
jgi:hypothetical protein